MFEENNEEEDYFNPNLCMNPSVVSHSDFDQLPNYNFEEIEGVKTEQKSISAQSSFKKRDSKNSSKTSTNLTYQGVDKEYQDKMLKRKRQNREAAQKSREQKKIWTEILENDNNKLINEIKKAKAILQSYENQIKDIQSLMSHKF